MVLCIFLAGSLMLSSLFVIITYNVLEVLLLILASSGAGIGLLGLYNNSSTMVEVSHYMLAILIFSGLFIFNEIHNVIYLLIIITTTLISRLWFHRCLYLDYSRDMIIPDVGFNVYNVIFVKLILYCFYKLYWLL